MRRRWLDGDLSRLRFTVTLVVIALVGALIRVVYVRGILTTKSFGFDSTWYYLQSGLIFNGKGFVDPAKFLASGATSATAWHPPAYSTLLAVEYKLGVHGIRTMQAIGGRLRQHTLPRTRRAGAGDRSRAGCYRSARRSSSVDCANALTSPT